MSNNRARIQIQALLTAGPVSCLRRVWCLREKSPHQVCLDGRGNRNALTVCVNCINFISFRRQAGTLHLLSYLISWDKKGRHRKEYTSRQGWGTKRLKSRGNTSTGKRQQADPPILKALERPYQPPLSCPVSRKRGNILVFHKGRLTC